MTKAAELIAAGQSDQAVADALNALTPGGAPMSSMAVSRHRRQHIMRVVQDRLAVVSKGAAPRQERDQLAAAASADAPCPQQFVDAFLGLKAQAEKLQRIEDRLERMAAMAETNESPNGVAQIAAQQLRGVEVGAKLVGVGGYASTRGAGNGSTHGMVFAVNIQFSGGRTESVVVGAAPVGVPDAELVEDDELL